MGKKKSVVLMVLLTIVIVVLCAVTLFPPFSLPGGVEKWNPVTLQFDLGTDLGGGYYAYYYPEGVISETEYKDNLPEVVEGDQDSQQTYDDYVESYLQHGGLYLKTDADLGIVENGEVSGLFKESFKRAADTVSARFNRKQYSDYRVAVVDDYSLRVELPASENGGNVGSALSLFAETGEITLQVGGEKVTAIKDGAKVSDLISGVSVATRYKTSYLKLTFTSAGKEMIDDVKGDLSEAPTSSSSSSSSTTLDIVVGDTTVASIYSDSIMDSYEVRVRPATNNYVNEEIYKDYLETVEILIESAMAAQDLDVTFTTSAVRSFEPVYGKNVLTLLYIALGVILLAILVLPAVKTGRFGVVSAYASLSYLIVTAMCFAFITGGVFEITLGSVAAFLAGLVLVNVLQYHIYGAIKTEFDLGKTVESSVKGGYKKTLWGIVDIYAVLLLSSLALLIGAAGLNTLALQMLVCVVTGAFCNLLWARAINFTFLSASKNKYKYFRFVREDDDDE